MADDTVAAARRDYENARAEYIRTPHVAGLWQSMDRKLDALIAAVRAEMQEAIDTKDRAHAAAIDREFALADKLEAATAEIQRLKLKHADGYERGPALTDADVDAFLAAVDEQDPERVERIRKLFNKKLKQTLDAHPGLAMRAPKPDPE